MFVHFFQIILNFLYVCRSVSWLAFLLKLDKYRDISSSVWDIFLKFFGGIPGMFVHLFQIILNFTYVSQSFCWLTSLLKLYKYNIAPWAVIVLLTTDVLQSAIGEEKESWQGILLLEPRPKLTSKTQQLQK